MRGTASSEESPHRLGSYAITRLIGRGGMGSVFEARHVRLGKRVAVKVLEPHLARDARCAARFVREGRAAAAIRHPNVVEVFEAGEEGDRAYLVMELLEGEDLASRLASAGRLSVQEALAVIVPVACGVGAAHDAGVVHRDVKPHNVFLSRERAGVRPVVLDFGISKELGDDVLTATEALLGTLDYMAPEQAHSAKAASPASDQYSLAIVLYECLTGVRPFRGESTYTLLHAIVTEPVVAPREHVPELPAELEDAILRAMDRQPAHRFADVRAFARALLPFAGEDVARAAARELDHGEPPPREGHAPGAPVTVATEPGSMAGVTAPRRARRALGTKLVAAVSLVVVLGGFALLRAGSSGHSPRDREGALTPSPGSTSPALVAPPAPPEASRPQPSESASHEGTASAPDSAAPIQSINVASPTPAGPRVGPVVSAAQRPSAVPVSSHAAPPPGNAPRLGNNGAPILE